MESLIQSESLVTQNPLTCRNPLILLPSTPPHSIASLHILPIRPLPSLISHPIPPRIRIHSPPIRRWFIRPRIPVFPRPQAPIIRAPKVHVGAAFGGPFAVAVDVECNTGDEDSKTEDYEGERESGPGEGCHGFGVVGGVAIVIGI